MVKSPSSTHNKLHTIQPSKRTLKLGWHAQKTNYPINRANAMRPRGAWLSKLLFGQCDFSRIATWEGEYNVSGSLQSVLRRADKSSFSPLREPLPCYLCSVQKFWSCCAKEQPLIQRRFVRKTDLFVRVLYRSPSKKYKKNMASFLLYYIMLLFCTYYIYRFCCRGLNQILPLLYCLLELKLW